MKASELGFLRKCRTDAVMRRIHAKEKGDWKKALSTRLILIHDQGSKNWIQREDESRARCEIDRTFVRNTRRVESPASLSVRPSLYFPCLPLPLLV